MFYYKIKFLAYIISNLNTFNIILQSPKLDISQIKKQINGCWNFILDLLVKPEILKKGKIELLNLNWEDENLSDNTFKASHEFLSSLATEVNSKYHSILTKT